MKLSNVKPSWLKFIAGLTAYAVVLWGITIPDNYHVIIYGFACMCFVTYAMALWALVKGK